MKNVVKLFFLTVLFLNVNSLLAGGNLETGFTIGASIPSESIGKFSNIDSLILKIDNKDTQTKLQNEIINTGYNIGIRLQLPLSESIYLSGGLGIHRFPEAEVVVYDNNDPTKVWAKLREVNNFIPFDAGLNIDLVDLKLFQVYGLVNVSYNFLYQSIDIIKTDVTIPVTYTESKMSNRFGAGLGAGLKFDLKLIELGLEGRFNRSNLLLAENGELNKDFYTLNLIVFF
jgi:hypothetical protein